MNNFKDKVAVVTGAASGIGYGLAEHCVKEGMKVVLADIEKEALSKAEQRLKDQGGAVLAVQTDVSKMVEIEALAQATVAEYGQANLLFNNAGVAKGGTIWESSMNDWEWVMGVNLWGLIYGIRTFMPIMLSQHDECHIVNTASMAGVTEYHPASSYQVTKHAVVGLTENLHYSLEGNPKINASVLCPGWVQTRILESSRNRPDSLADPEVDVEITPEREALIKEFTNRVTNGLTPQQVAQTVFDGIRNKRLYLFTETEFYKDVQNRAQTMLHHFDHLHNA